MSFIAEDVKEHNRKVQQEIRSIMDREKVQSFFICFTVTNPDPQIAEEEEVIAVLGSCDGASKGEAGEKLRNIVSVGIKLILGE